MQRQVRRTLGAREEGWGEIRTVGGPRKPALLYVPCSASLLQAAARLEAHSSDLCCSVRPPGWAALHCSNSGCSGISTRRIVSAPAAAGTRLSLAQQRRRRGYSVPSRCSLRRLCCRRPSRHDENKPRLHARPRVALRAGAACSGQSPDARACLPSPPAAPLHSPLCLSLPSRIVRRRLPAGSAAPRAPQSSSLARTLQPLAASRRSSGSRSRRGLRRRRRRPTWGSVQGVLALSGAGAVRQGRRAAHGGGGHVRLVHNAPHARRLQYRRVFDDGKGDNGWGARGTLSLGWRAFQGRPLTAKENREALCHTLPTTTTTPAYAGACPLRCWRPWRGAARRQGHAPLVRRGTAGAPRWTMGERRWTMSCLVRSCDTRPPPPPPSSDARG